MKKLDYKQIIEELQKMINSLKEVYKDALNEGYDNRYNVGFNNAITAVSDELNRLLGE